MVQLGIKNSKGYYMSQMVWAYKRLPDLNNSVGFVEVTDAKAITLLASGDVQDPKIGAKALKYIDGAYDVPPPLTKPSGFAKPSSSAITTTGFKVSWVAPSGGSPVDNYEVGITTMGSDITGSPFTMAGSTLSKTISGVGADAEYEVTVTAINAGGNVVADVLTVQTPA